MHTLGDTLGAVVDAGVGAQRECPRDPVVGAADDQHARAGQFGKLQARNRDAAADADDQHRLACL